MDREKTLRLLRAFEDWFTVTVRQANHQPPHINSEDELDRIHVRERLVDELLSSEEENE